MATLCIHLLKCWPYHWRVHGWVGYLFMNLEHCFVIDVLNSKMSPKIKRRTPKSSPDIEAIFKNNINNHKCYIIINMILRRLVLWDEWCVMFTMCLIILKVCIAPLQPKFFDFFWKNQIDSKYRSFYMLPHCS